MSWKIFWSNELIGLLTLVLSVAEKTATMAQMLMKYGKRGVPILIHGGWLVDITIVGWTLAGILTRYAWQWSRTAIIVCAIASAGMCAAAYYFYLKASVDVPNFTAVNGHMTAAGWIHAVYSVPVLTIYLLFFFATWSLDSLVPVTLISLAVGVHIFAGFALPALYVGDFWENNMVQYCLSGVTILWILGCVNLIRVYCRY
jgi:hypothetical protein